MKLVQIAVESFGVNVRLSFVSGNQNAFYNLAWLCSTQNHGEESELSDETSFNCSRAKLASAVHSLRSPTLYASKGKLSGHSIEFVCVAQLSSNCESASSHEYATGTHDNHSENVWQGYAPSIAKHFDAIPA